MVDLESFNVEWTKACACTNKWTEDQRLWLKESVAFAGSDFVGNDCFMIDENFTWKVLTAAFFGKDCTEGNLDTYWAPSVVSGVNLGCCRTESSGSDHSMERSMSALNIWPSVVSFIERKIEFQSVWLVLRENWINYGGLATPHPLI